MINISEQAFSPTPIKKIESREQKEGKSGFGKALLKVAAGKKITKLEWKNKEFYGVLKDSRLMLHKPDGKLYDWIITEGDIIGTDYIVI